MPNSTYQHFTMLSVETTGLAPLETVSNSLADTVLIKTGSGNGDLESSQRELGGRKRPVRFLLLPGISLS